MNTLLFIQNNIGGGQIMILTLFTLGLYIYALVDVLRSDFRGSNTKILWVIVILLAPFLGVLLYLIMGRKDKVRID